MSSSWQNSPPKTQRMTVIATINAVLLAAGSSSPNTMDASLSACASMAFQLRSISRLPSAPKVTSSRSSGEKTPSHDQDESRPEAFPASTKGKHAASARTSRIAPKRTFSLLVFSRSSTTAGLLTVPSTVTPSSPYLSYILRDAGTESTSYACVISWNSVSWPSFLSGWYRSASLR